MKCNHQQPLTSLPHVNDLATCERLMTETLTALRRLDDAEGGLGFLHNYRELYRELAARHAELTARA